MSLLRRIKQGNQQGSGGDQPPETAAIGDTKGSQIDLPGLSLRLQKGLFFNLYPTVRDLPRPEARRALEDMLETLLNTMLAEANIVLKQSEKQKLSARVLDAMESSFECFVCARHPIDLSKEMVASRCEKTVTGAGSV